LKGRLTYSEFLDWLAFIEWDEKRHTKLDWYLAQITAEIRRGLVSNPKNVKAKDFLIELVDAKQSTKVAQSKQAWLGAVGIKRKIN